MIRLFTAIGLPADLVARLSLMQGGVPGARWSPPENLHLTLRFIGEVDEVVANDIDDMLTGLRAAPFDLALMGCGSFGSKDPHSLWIGVGPCPPLLHLVARIDSLLQRMGLAAETRKYTPHVTLARLKDAPAPRVQAFLADHAAFTAGPFTVNAFGLYSSHAGSQGRHYVLERRYPLG
ncbi:MAG: RNA 2',3'-cyclic phosphodiesterase [Alphaproteobacteria bacterium]